MSGDFVLRPATAADAVQIAKLMRASMSSHAWMPTLHTPDEDLGFVRSVMLLENRVTVAESQEAIVGFIAVRDNWINQLYVSPGSFGRGIGSALLETIRGLPGGRLYCFQQNEGARRFYERHGFRAEAFSDGSGNEEGLPDALYVRP